MRKGNLKQLIEMAVFRFLKEIEDSDETHLVPDVQGDYHETQGDDSRFWGNRGAGILLIAKDTGHILLVHRSAYVNEPGTWGIPGGMIDVEDSSPSEAAKREAQEELGYSGAIELKPAHVFKAGKFRFFNFIGVIPEEFEPTLDWENEDAGWYSINDLPSALHFGIKSLLSNSKSQIQDVLDSVGH